MAGGEAERKKREWGGGARRSQTARGEKQTRGGAGGSGESGVCGAGAAFFCFFTGGPCLSKLSRIAPCTSVNCAAVNPAEVSKPVSSRSSLLRVRDCLQ